MEMLNVKKLETDAASPLLRDILTRIGVNEVEDPTRVVIEVRYYIATEPFIISESIRGFCQLPAIFN